MAAASYYPRILIPKYEQTDNVKPLTANRGLQFAVGWPNLDLKVSITKNGQRMSVSSQTFPYIPTFDSVSGKCKQNLKVGGLKKSPKGSFMTMV